MFSNILVPTDGSELSLNAARQAVKIAKATGARITAFHVAKPYKLPLENDDSSAARRAVPQKEHAAQIEAEARQYLDAVKSAATAGGVECSAQYVASVFPAEAIVKAAGEYGCDGIVMGSHGRSGLKKLLLGSETQKVLAATNVSVLVVR